MLTHSAPPSARAPLVVRDRPLSPDRRRPGPIWPINWDLPLPRWCRWGSLLRAARHLGLKAKTSRGTPERLALTPLPALARIRQPDGSLHTVILAQTDGQRVLLQDPGVPGGRPTIEGMDAFARQWTGELILITSRASLAGELARFDFSWFIPSLIKYRKLLGEVLLISFMLQLFALVSPLFFQS